MSMRKNVVIENFEIFFLMFIKMGEEIQGLTRDVLKLLKILGLDSGLLSTVNTKM